MSEAQLALKPAEPSVALMLQAVIQQGVTEQNVAALERLCDLYERMEAKNAERAYAAAFVKVQEELPEIVAQSIIPNRGKYERFEDVMHVLKPIYTRHGFSVSFEQHAEENRIKAICHVRHEAGHATSTPFAVRLGGKADSDTQADCKASTTAKRNALLMAFNIVIRQDFLQSEDDPRNDGGFITQQQAYDLRDWLDSLGGDRVKFLALAGAKTFEEIPSAKLETLQDALKAKERARK